MIFNFNALEVFQIAVKIEENGRVFYENAQNRVDDAEVQKLFKDLALQEIEHKKKFEELKAKLPPQTTSPTVWDPENEMDQYLKMMADGHVFGPGSDVDTQLKQIKNASDALKMAIQFEKDSVIFFLSMEEMTEEQQGRKFIGLLVKEEQEHARLMAKILEGIGAPLVQQRTLPEHGT